MSAPASAGTILVVEDEPRTVEVIRFFLESDGLAVLTAEDGPAALAAAAAHPPDVVLLDVMLPGLDGYEVCRRLKRHPSTEYVPVIFLTALRGTAELARAAAAGADEFLSKPFDHVELVTRVRALLRAKRYHDALRSANADLERRVAERTAELERAMAALQDLDRLKSEFIAKVSHELRTPLLHVKGYVDLLGDGAMGLLTPKQAEGLGVAQAAIGRLERVVDDVVDFSSLNEQRLALEPIYLADVCRHVIHAAAGGITRGHVSVTLTAPPDLPRVKADRVALTRILRHLLDNAIKFGPPGQVVQIVAERGFGDRVRVAVRDHGPGLTPSQLAHAFDVFYQADGSATRPASGLGMGLALVKKLVEAHGGQVEIKSEPGRGCVVGFELEAA